MIPPGRNRPRSSASVMIANAARSLTEPPGFKNSALPRIVHRVISDARRSLISGVFPTVPTKPSRICMFPPCALLSGRTIGRRPGRRKTGRGIYGSAKAGDHDPPPGKWRTPAARTGALQAVGGKLAHPLSGLSHLLTERKAARARRPEAAAHRAAGAEEAVRKPAPAAGEALSRRGPRQRLRRRRLPPRP